MPWLWQPLLESAVTLLSGGDGVITLGDDTVAGTGAITSVGAGAATEAADTGSGTSAVTQQGAATVTDGADAASGTAQIRLEGGGAATEASDSADGTARFNPQGVADIAQADDTAGGTGALTLQGAGSLVEADDTLAAAGSPVVAGDGAVTEQPDAAGGEGIAGEFDLIGAGAATGADDTVVPGFAELDPCGVDWLAVQRAMRAWVIGGSGLPAQSVYWGQQDSKRAVEPAIEMRVYSTHTIGMGWLDAQTQYVTFPSKVVTVVSASTNTLTITNHGLANGDGPVRLSTTVTVPAGLSTSVDYWVIFVDQNTLKLASSFARSGGTGGVGTAVPVDITGTGSGTLTLRSTARTLRAGREIHYASRQILRVGLMLECHTSAAVGMQAAMSILNRVKARLKLPSQQDTLHAAGLGLTDVERVRAIHGVRNALQFEPRALCEVYFSLAMEECEDGTIFESARVRNALTGKQATVP